MKIYLSAHVLSVRPSTLIYQPFPAQCLPALLYDMLYRTARSSCGSAGWGCWQAEEEHLVTVATQRAWRSSGMSCTSSGQGATQARLRSALPAGTLQISTG